MSQKERSKRKRSKACRQRKNYKRYTERKNREHLSSALEWFLSPHKILDKIRLHGNTKWSVRSLVCLALLWSLSECRNLTDAFDHALGCYQKMFGSFALGTYQGFMGALAKWTPRLMDGLWPLLHQRMEDIGSKYWRIDGWLPLAFDGSRSTAPRTSSNEQAFCAANYGGGKTAKYRKKKSKGMRRKRNQANQPQPQEPQAWITLIWHMGLRLPWIWRLGPSNSSERGHVMEMIHRAKLLKDTLFCGDAGFIGYALWAEILQRRGHFLVRVGANVSLLAESANYQMLKNGRVLCWPKDRMRSNEPPLRLRLVQVCIGKTPVWILTSVLNQEELTPAQLVKFYKLRWGIELEFRGLKQTLDRAKLRSRNPQRLLAELNWSIMAMAVAELFALKEQLAKSQPRSCSKQPLAHPAKRSLAKTIRAIRQCLRTLDDVPPPGNDLSSLLRAAVTDNYQRTKPKPARYRPPNPDKKPLGNPKLRRITPQEKKKLHEIERKLAA
jgi:hypothetical protein